VEQYHLLLSGELVVVGVSGGPDSVSLLHMLCWLKREYRLTLHVAHLHHGLRGSDADGDADYVQALAADWGLPCTVERVDVPTVAREHRLSIEEAARRARYGFLWRVAEATGAKTIAVGHNADDQAETVLMHWLRGSGLAGLRGMLPLTLLGDYRLFPAPERQRAGTRLCLIRPLLVATRAEIEAYCEFYSLTPRFDRSNLDTTYFRNWLRQEVLPLLAQHNPNVREVIRRSARVIADDHALLRSVLEDVWPSVIVEQSAARIAFDLKAWRCLPASLQRSTLREAIHLLRRSLRNINFVHVENALQVGRDGTTGEKSTLPQGLVLSVDYERLTISDESDPGPKPAWPLLPAGCLPLAVTVPGRTQLPGSDWALVASVVTWNELPRDWASNADPWRAFLDLEVVGNCLWLRTREPGDRFQPLGMGSHSVKLTAFLTNEKVPRNVRDLLPLLVRGKEIAWVCGQRLDERAKVAGGTTEVLMLSFERDRCKPDGCLDSGSSAS
jgi:tRNA(Ile)-lysidine synthase